MRIVAISDQHGFLPDIPPCDLLIVAGDICPDRFGPFVARLAPDQQVRWFNRTIRPWLRDSPATHKILTWGNHDWCGELCDFSADAPGVASTTTLQIVVDQVTHVPRPRSSGVKPEGAISIWATPWSNEFMGWAFMKEPAQLAEIYDAIPAGVDILVTHQPPYGHGGRTFDSDSGKVVELGSRELLAAVERIRPKLVICGHIHGGHGRYEHRGIAIYNASVVDERYRLVHEPTVIELP